MIVTAPITKGAVHLPLLVMLPALADQSIDVSTAPATVAEKVVGVPCPTFGAGGVIAEMVTATVTVTFLVTKSPAALVTVSIYVTVAVKLDLVILIGLVTVPIPLSIEPVPPANTPVRVVLEPVVMVALAAVKLEMVAAGTTVTVMFLVTKSPAALVTVSM